MQFTGGRRVRRVSARVRFRISASVRARKIELRIQIAMYWMKVKRIELPDVNLRLAHADLRQLSAGKPI